MARSEFVLNVGDDNVVLTRFNDRKVANAWLGSPDPAMAQEELGEALAADPKARISVIFDTLDQSFKEEEIPRVGVLDRRKILARHINMAFPGANLRGARLVAETKKKTLLYEFASVPLDGRVPGWVDFAESLPNPKGGYYAIAPENADLVKALAPKDAPVEEGQNHWRHLIGINVSGGLRQIIEKNGRLSLTRLTQAPPPETSPADFADMIIRDFKATITYIRRLGYQVGEPLDVVALTTRENKAVLEELTWDGARSVSVYTPYEAGLTLGLGSLGREDQAYCDVLHAAWFASKRRPVMPLTRSAALGDTKDDLRELAYAAAPYAAGIAVAATLGWGGWTGYELLDYRGRNEALGTQLVGLTGGLATARERVGGLAYDPKRVRNIIEVDKALDAGQVDIVPTLHGIFEALQSDAVLMDFKFNVAGTTPAAGAAAAEKAEYVVTTRLKLASVVTTADEAVSVARKLEGRLNASFGKGFKVQMTREPANSETKESSSGGLFGQERTAGSQAVRSDEAFYTEFRIAKVGS